MLNILNIQLLGIKYHSENTQMSIFLTTNTTMHEENNMLLDVS
jgi:hypothetical protein